jgi:predicted redox protein, regulator of disulfide bond formation
MRIEAVRKCNFIQEENNMEKIVRDVKGQDCPIPLITLKDALKDAEPGQVIDISFTCPEALNTLPDYCDEHELEILSLDRQADRSWKITIRNH